MEMLRSLGLPGRSWQKVLRRPPEAAEEASATLALQLQSDRFRMSRALGVELLDFCLIVDGRPYWWE